MVVLGNSTDFWPNLYVGIDQPTPDAWPALVGARLSVEYPELSVEVRNEAGRGAGHDVGLQGVSSMYQLLEAIIETGVGRPAVLVVAPSVVDLQLKERDVDDSVAALLDIVALGRTSFDAVLVAPMHPVARRQGEATARAVAEFNERLVAAGLTAGYDRSVLLSDDDLFGQPDLYDDFDDERGDTPGPDPDGIHPDVDGHRAIAEAITPVVADAVAGFCRP